MSLLHTAKLRALDSMHVLSRLLCAPAGKLPMLLLSHA
jgi:hypothetical protein